MSTALPQSYGFRLDGKRALVTGAGRGIGLAAAVALAEAGASVTLVARGQAEIEAAASELTARGWHAEALAMDVGDGAQMRRLIGEAEPFDILVNNAGANRPAPFVEVSEMDFDTIFDLNVKAAFFVAQAVAKRLVETKRPGSIINMSSQMGHVGGQNRTVYCASKHAMEGFTKAMAIELAPVGIRVNTLCPTYIETPLTEPYFSDPAFKAAVLSKIKLGRLGKVEDLMGAVVFLASDSSAMMTGSALKIDGGWTAE